MTKPCDLPAGEARRLIGTKELSPVELLQSCVDRIEAVNPTVNAMVATCYDRAREEAEAAERAVMQGEPLGPLHGLPFGVKDLNLTEGVRTTFGSLIHEDFVPEEDERMVADLRAAGAILVGKTNTPEFGAGANTVNKVYGATVNPFDTARTCGGSSGGSAVALATGMLPLCTGSDTGGSLRIPAGFCGITAIRATPGVVASERRIVGPGDLHRARPEPERQPEAERQTGRYEKREGRQPSGSGGAERPELTVCIHDRNRLILSSYRRLTPW